MTACGNDSIYIWECTVKPTAKAVGISLINQSPIFCIQQNQEATEVELHAYNIIMELQDANTFFGINPLPQSAVTDELPNIDVMDNCYISFSPLSISMPYYFSVLSSLLLFHQVLFFPFHPYFPFLFTLLSMPISLLLSIPILCYFPFLLYFCSPFLSSVAWYCYHKHCLSLIIFDHVLLTLLDNLYPYLLPIAHIIFIPSDGKVRFSLVL